MQGLSDVEKFRDEPAMLLKKIAKALFLPQLGCLCFRDPSHAAESWDQVRNGARFKDKSLINVKLATVGWMEPKDWHQLENS